MSDPDLQPSFMELALQQARLAAARGEVPVGAVVVRDGRVLAAAHNLRESRQDPTAHAELLALRRAARAAGSWRLDGCTLHVSLEPCAMCAGAMVLARIRACAFGAADPKGGMLGSLGDLSALPGLNHRFRVVPGLLAEPAAALLRGFFRELRQQGGG